MVSNLNRQEGEPGGLNAIQAANYGGLNTISNPLNMPVEDSAALRNMRVTQIGTIAKRRGTVALGESISAGRFSGNRFISYTLRNGQRVIIAKMGKRLEVYRMTNNLLNGNQNAPRLSLAVGFNEVWSTEAENVRCDFVITSEPTTRIIMTTGINTVVQMSIVQAVARSATKTINSGDSRLIGRTASEVMLFRNGEYLPAFGNWSINTTTGVITLVDNPPGDSFYDIIAFSWQWWAEAMRLNGKQITREVTQFQINNPTDLTVAVPTDLMYDLEPLGSSNYPISAYSNNNPLTYYTPQLVSSTANSYVWTQGAAYVAGATPVPGFTFIAFGAFTAALPTTPRRVILFRHYRLPFSGYTGTPANLISVFDTERAWTQNTAWGVVADDYPKQGSDSAPTYGLAQVTGSFRTVSQPVSGSGIARWIRFDSSNNTRITASDSLSVVSLNPLTGDGSRVIGTSAISAVGAGTGQATPIYGLYEICDFSKRSFPRTVCLYSGRLALGGFPDAPLRVALSNILDSATQGVYYNNFQTLLEPISDSNALYFELNGNADDSVTAMSEFQNQLFVFCRKGIYRVSGADSGTVTPTAFNVSFVASIGCVNSQSVVRVDKTLYFLSQAGMYDIVPTIEAGDFTAGERSIKIKNLFNKTSSISTEESSWVEYDPVFQEVYVGIPDSTLETEACSRLFVYNILRDSWTEYTHGMRGRWHSLGAVVSVNGISQGRDVVVFTLSPYSTESAAEVIPLLLDSDKYIDSAWTVEIVADGQPYSSDLGLAVNLDPYSMTSPMWEDRVLTYTIDSRITEYKVNAQFSLLPLANVVDCEVFVNDVRLEHGVDWQKTSRDTIVLLKLFSSGAILKIRKIDDMGKPNFVMYVDNVKAEYGVDFMLDPSDNKSIVFLKTIPTGSVVTTGIEYEAWHFTPLLTLENLDVDKRFMRYIGYYRNNDFQETYETKDVNTNTNQDPTALVGMPKQRADVSVGFVYQDTGDGYISTDIYGYSDLFWDVALTDIPPSALQYQPNTRIVENLLGFSYGVQVVNYCRSDGGFELSGYQVVVRAGGRHSRHWST